MLLLKIAVLSYLGVNDRRKGGSEVHAFNVTEALCKLGWDVLYLHTRPPVCGTLSKDCPVHVGLGYRRGFALINYYLFNLIASLKLLKFRPHAIITSNFNFAAFIGGLILRVPVLLIFYQLGYRPSPGRAVERWLTGRRNFRGKIHSFLTYLHNEWPLRDLRFSRILTLSRHTKAVCESIKVRTPSANIVSLGTGVHATYERSSEKKFDVCCLSRLVSYKRIDVLIEAVGILNRKRKVTCAIVGDGDSRGALERLAEDLPVSFLGWLEGEAKHNVLRNSGVFCLPSPIEGFGIVFLEAMVHRLPLVFCDRPPMNKELKGCGLTFKDGDAEDLARALTEIMENPSLAAELSEAGYRLVNENFTWEKVAERYHRLLLDVIHASR